MHRSIKLSARADVQPPRALRHSATASILATCAAVFRDPSFEAVCLFSLFGLVVSVTLFRVFPEHLVSVSAMLRAY